MAVVVGRGEGEIFLAEEECGKNRALGLLTKNKSKVMHFFSHLRKSQPF